MFPKIVLVFAYMLISLTHIHEAYHEYKHKKAPDRQEKSKKDS